LPSCTSAFRSRISSSVDFVTLMLPVEVHRANLHQVVSDLGMLNSYAGLTIPLIAPATATFYSPAMTVPDESSRGPHGRAEQCVFSGTYCFPFVQDIDGCAVRDPVHLRLETSTCGRCWPPPAKICTRWSSASSGRMTFMHDAANEWNVAHCHLAMLPPALVVVLMQKVVRQGPG
jgi:sn-glycerol 3-phosphate transport system permease protein